MAIVGVPDLNNYRLRLAEIQTTLITGSISDPYQLGGSQQFPLWFNTITLQAPSATRIGTAQSRWDIQARCFLAVGEYNEATYEKAAAEADGHVPIVIAYFDQPTFNPFITATYTTNQAGYVPQSVQIQGTSPAEYVIKGGALVGSAYEITWSHWINYRAT